MFITLINHSFTHHNLLFIIDLTTMCHHESANMYDVYQSPYTRFVDLTKTFDYIDRTANNIRLYLLVFVSIKYMSVCLETLQQLNVNAF